MDEELQARVHLLVEDTKSGPFALPSGEPVSAGRGAGYGLRIRSPWVPRKLCRFLPYDLGWVVQVGPRAQMQLQDTYVGSHVFVRDSVVALQEGEMLLSFPGLDDFLQLGAVIGPGAAAGLESPRDEQVDEHPRHGTLYAASSLALTPVQRDTLAAAFGYLIREEPKPTNITAAAAAKLGRSEPAVKKTLGAIRSKVNLERWGPDLTTYEQLGEYFVHLTRSLTWHDLPEHSYL